MLRELIRKNTFILPTGTNLHKGMTSKVPNWATIIMDDGENSLSVVYIAGKCVVCRVSSDAYKHQPKHVDLGYVQEVIDFIVGKYSNYIFIVEKGEIISAGNFQFTLMNNYSLGFERKKSETPWRQFKNQVFSNAIVKRSNTYSKLPSRPEVENFIRYLISVYEVYPLIKDTAFE